MRILICFTSLLALLLPVLSLAAGETIVPAQITAWLMNPNITYLLLLIGIYGIFFELANPGLIFPGVTGIIALLLMLYSFQLLPVNSLGIMFILLGIGFMIAEMYIASMGLIGLLGLAGFIVGSTLLFNDSNYHVDWMLIASMTIISFIFIFIIVSLAIKSHKRKVITGTEGLIGSEGVVLSVMNEQTVVRVAGEIWEAKSPIMLNPGDKIKVTQVQGLVLFIEPVKNAKKTLSGE